MAEITKMPSVLRTTQMRYWFWNLVSTPKPKSDGIADFETGFRLVQGARKEEAEKHQKVDAQRAQHGRHDKAAAARDDLAFIGLFGSWKKSS